MTLEVDVASGAVGPWFWCLESSFGIPFWQHACGDDSTARRSEMDGSVTGAVVQLDPSWPADALYFVDMYCKGPCTWHLSVVAVDAATAR